MAKRNANTINRNANAKAKAEKAAEKTIDGTAATENVAATETDEEKALRLAKEAKAKRVARAKARAEEQVRACKKIKEISKFSSMLEYGFNEKNRRDTKNYCQSLKHACQVLAGYKNNFCNLTANQLMKVVLDKKIDARRQTQTKEGALITYYSVNSLRSALKKYLNDTIKANQNKA